MTLPEERWNSIEQARQFMLRLLDPKQTPGVPKRIRLDARARLKHFPSATEMALLCDVAETSVARRNVLLVIENESLKDEVAKLRKSIGTMHYMTLGKLGGKR